MRVFAVFLLAYTLSQFYRSFLAVIAPELAFDLELTPQALGNMQAMWILGFVAAQFPVGWALDALGPRRTVSTLMIAAVAGAILFAWASSAAMLNIAMLLIGIGCAPVYMGALYIFGRVNPPEQFALLSSWLLGLGTSGNLLAASPLAWAATEWGWRDSMLVMAIATALSATIVFLLVRDPPRLTPDASAPGMAAALMALISTRALWPLIPITFTSYAVVLAERGLWAGPYLSEVHGLDAVARGNALLFMAAAMSAGAIVFGPLDRLLNTRKWIVLAGCAPVSALFLYLGLANPGGMAAISALALIGGLGMTYGVLMAHGRAFFPDHLLGRGMTFLNIFFIGGAGLLQPVSGAIVTSMRESGATPEAAYATIHLIFGVLLAMAALIYLAARDRPPRLRSSTTRDSH